MSASREPYDAAIKRLELLAKEIGPLAKPSDKELIADVHEFLRKWEYFPRSHGHLVALTFEPGEGK